MKTVESYALCKECNNPPQYSLGAWLYCATHLPTRDGAERVELRGITKAPLDIAVRDFLALISRMKTNEEICDETGEDMSGDDAVETVSGLIEHARALLAKLDKEE